MLLGWDPFGGQQEAEPKSAGTQIRAVQLRASNNKKYNNNRSCKLVGNKCLSNHWITQNKVHKFCRPRVLGPGGGANTAIRLATPDKVNARGMQPEVGLGTKGKTTKTLAQQNALQRSLTEFNSGTR